MPHRLTFLRDSFANDYANQILTQDGASGQIKNETMMLLTLNNMKESGLITDFQGDFQNGFSVDFNSESDLYLAYSMIHQMQSNTLHYNQLLERLSVYILNRNVKGFEFYLGKGGADGGCDFFGVRDPNPAIDILNLESTSIASSIIGQCKLHSANHTDGEIPSNKRDLIGTQELFKQTAYFDRWAPDVLKNNEKLKKLLQDPFGRSILILIYIGGKDRKIDISDLSSTWVTIGPSEFASLLAETNLIGELRGKHPHVEVKDFLTHSMPILDLLI